MPWQRYVVDVALELDPGTGEFAYSEVIVTVPRQQGKTTLILSLAAHRVVGLGPPFGKRQNVVYVAQTRNHARKKFEDEHLPILLGSSLRTQVSRPRMTNGNEALIFKNGSKYGIESTTEKAGHGDVIDLGFLDEAFSQVDDRVEQAMKPAMMTRLNAQFWVDSTAGTAASTYLLDKNELGRQLVSQDVTDGVAYFEWRGDPDADPADPATWYDCMPALGLTVRESTVAGFQRSMKPAEFRRAFLNIADTERGSEWLLVSETQWNALKDPASNVSGPVMFSIDATPDGSFAAVGVAGRRADGNLHVEVVKHERDTKWTVPYMQKRPARWRSVPVVVDPAGPAAPLIRDLEKAGIEVLKPSPAERSQGCGRFVAAVKEGGLIRHRDQIALTTAVAGAVPRNYGDGAMTIARRSTTVDICPLMAAVYALWGFELKDGEQVLSNDELMAGLH